MVANEQEEFGTSRMECSYVCLLRSNLTLIRVASPLQGIFTKIDQ